MPVKMYQFRIHPKCVTDVHSRGTMFGTKLMSSSFFPFGEPVEIRKASTTPVQRNSTSPLQADVTTPKQKNSTVCGSNEDFIIQLELRDYRPGNIKITSDDHQVTIIAKHEMPHNTDGFVSRTVTTVYNLPEDVDGKFLTAAMHSQGILIIRAARSTTTPNSLAKISVWKSFKIAVFSVETIQYFH